MQAKEKKRAVVVVLEEMEKKKQYSTPASRKEMNSSGSQARQARQAPGLQQRKPHFA
jgi:hypothetical protein